jgi:DNA-binding MarR family transcriptional regulator
MPTNTKRNPAKGPTKFQTRIIGAIALEGHLSNKKITERLHAQHSDVSVAIRSLLETGYVVLSYTQIQERRAHEKYYALTKKGFQEFINGSPSPKDFCRAILGFHSIRARSTKLGPMDNKEFEEYCTLFEYGFLNYASTHGHLVHSPFYNKIYEQWLAENHSNLYERNYLKRITSIIHSPFFEKCYTDSLRKYDIDGITVVQKVLECLAIHRSITERQLIEYLNSKQEDINKMLTGKTFRYPEFIWHQIKNDYDITDENIKRVINRYTLTESYLQEELQMPEDLDYSKITKKYLDFLSRFVVIKMDNVDGPRYELSLLGVLLTLAIVTHPHQQMFFKDSGHQKSDEDLMTFYDIVSINYTDKLPLIFGKWALLTNTWQYAYQWFLPVLYQKVIDEFTRSKNPGSVSIALGGVKEYQETMREIAFHTAARLFELYRDISSILHHPDKKDDSEIPLHGSNEAGLQALENKQKQLAALLKYVDLGRFVGELTINIDFMHNNRQTKTIYDSELSIIEKSLASEITFLFYINLARDRFLDYTDEGRNFLGDERDTDYKDTAEYHILKPVDFLKMILKSDKELKNIFLNWIADIKNYHQKSGAQIEEFERTIEKLKLRSK